jgi:hypothetical protein
VIDEEKSELILKKNLTNRLYVKKQLYGLQMGGKYIFVDLNNFNMLNTRLLNFGVKIEEEDKTIFLSASLPPSYDNMITW